MKEIKKVVFINHHYNGSVVSTLEFSFREVKGQYKLYRRETYENKFREEKPKPKGFLFFKMFDPEKIDEIVENHYSLLKMVGYTKVE